MDNIVYKDKGQFKHKPAEEVMLTEELSMLDLIQKVDMLEEKLAYEEQLVKQLHEAYEHLTALLKDKVLLEDGKTIIAEIDGQLERLKFDRVFPDMPINLKFYQVVNGKLVEDKSKIMEMI